MTSAAEIEHQTSKSRVQHFIRSIKSLQFTLTHMLARGCDGGGVVRIGARRVVCPGVGGMMRPGVTGGQQTIVQAVPAVRGGEVTPGASVQGRGGRRRGTVTMIAEMHSGLYYGVGVKETIRERERERNRKRERRQI